MPTINRTNAVKLIQGAGSRVFGVTFTKRTTGETRKGLFRLGETVKKGLKGGERAYDPKEHGLIPVYAMAGDAARADEKQNFRRSIPIEGILSVSIDGETFDVVPG